jgi:hypothetical protein
MTALWQMVKDEVRMQLRGERPFIAFAGAEANGRVTIRRVTELTAGQEEYARVAGLMFQEDDEIVCLQVGGKPLPIGRLQRDGISDFGISYHIAPQDIVGFYYDNRNVVGGEVSSTGYDGNRLYAVPFYVGPDGFAADRIAIDNGVGQAFSMRLGIYAMHATLFEPSALILDAGTVSLATTGVKEITIAQTLTADPPHYIVWLAFNNNAAVATIDSLINMLPLFGTTSAGSAQATWMHSSVTYAALPNPFTAGGAPTTTFSPRIMLRRS